MTEPKTTEAPVREGDVLAGKYRVERILGVGGMGVVVAAMHTELEQRVALKFLLPEPAKNPAVVARFAREARAAAKIKSEHVARVSDVGTMEDGQSSPYSATSTLAIDPLFISLEDVPDFAAAGGEARLSPLARESLELARSAGTVRYDLVRRAKADALARAFDAFLTAEWEQLTPRAAALAAYIARERWWLEDYALFQAVAATMPSVPWRVWPAPLRDREPAALDDQILGSGNILARVGRDLALAPETTADIVGELARRDEAVAIHVGISGHSLAQEICEEPARLEPAGDEAGEVFLRAEQAHHVRPVDEVAEAT